MTEITTMFWDIGGVLLSNGWDRVARSEAVAAFGLEPDEFDRRHQHVVLDFECGRVSIDEYLSHVVFYQPRTFSPDAFRAHMCSQSTGDPDMLSLVGTLAASGRYMMASLNNESLELNRHRIEAFGLGRVFLVFFSSCYLGSAKPAADIFQTALRITQRDPAECLFVDDRLSNVTVARQLGMTGIHFTGLPELRPALEAVGVAVGGSPGNLHQR